MMHGEEGDMHTMMEQCKDMMQSDHAYMHGMMAEDTEIACCSLTESDGSSEHKGHLKKKNITVVHFISGLQLLSELT
jgi:hypothetical protein